MCYTEFKTELEKIISELGHVDALSFDVPAKFHNAIQGPNGTTLNVLVGEQKTTLITFGAGDKVTVRGPKKELPRVKENIEALVRRAEKENVETIHVRLFYEIPVEELTAESVYSSRRLVSTSSLALSATSSARTVPA